MRALTTDYVHQVQPAAAPQRRGGLVVGMGLFFMLIGFTAVVLAAVALSSRLERLESRLASSEVCMKNLHIVMWRNKSEALVAAVDCPAAGQEE